ncbi:MAG: CpaF/VirB11 family protein [Propionibacteriaceae bacterium]|nr:CpaF/VirB11 family protein [Propionibacteriaceae bacterium]
MTTAQYAPTLETPALIHTWDHPGVCPPLTTRQHKDTTSPLDGINPHTCAVDSTAITRAPIHPTHCNIPVWESSRFDSVPDVVIDWGVIAQMRVEASHRLSARVGTDGIDITHHQDVGRVIIADLLEEQANLAMTAGQDPWSLSHQARMGQALFDSLFRLGRLQSLVDNQDIENIIICGADNVWTETCDGSLHRSDPVADSDDELIDFLSFIASRSEVNERSFSPAEPRLHLRLDNGARLAATAWVTPRPSVVIRRHRLKDITLHDLVSQGSLTSTCARFLAQAVRQRASIVVCGAQGAGKTTMMRALCAEIPSHETIGTFETEYELHLHQMTDRHPLVHAWEARPGSGEKDGAGRRVGEYLLDDALYDSFRFNLSRQIVGEVRGGEILAMVKAMQSGSGSLSTTHARSAEGAVRKLITCAMEAGPYITSDYASRAVSQDIDFVVHLEMTTTVEPGGGFRRHRWVKEIISLQASDCATGYSTSRVFYASDGEQLASLVWLPEAYAHLYDTGCEVGL